MKLHNYQKRALDFWMEKKRAYMAVDMGLGKTAVALHGIAKIRKPTLVIAPLKTIHTTWPDEIEKWNLPLTHQILHGKSKMDSLMKPADVYLINFEGLKWLYHALLSMAKRGVRAPFTELIIDEGTMVKSHSTQRFKMLKAMLVLFQDHRLILSGTPAPNGYGDLWSQYYLLDRGRSLESNYNHYRNKYFSQADYMGYTWEIRKEAVPIIREKIQPMTFRLDANDYLEMPERIDNKIMIKLPTKLRNTYKELEKEFFLELNDVEIEAFNKAALGMKLRQFLQGALYYQDEDDKRQWTQVHKLKLNALQDLVESTGQNILCAVQFKFELDMIRELYPDTPYIAGGVSQAKATEHIRAWNEGKIPLLLCHPASISHGVNLQEGGSLILWYGMTWSLEQYLQFIGRLYRQGQKESVVVNHFIVEDSVDEKVHMAIAERNMNQKALLDYLREVSHAN